MAGFFIMLERGFEEAAVRLAGQARQQRLDGLADVSCNAQVQRGTPAQCLWVAVDLDNFCVGRVELAIREVGAEHDQRVAVEHGVVAGAEADQAGHADVERVVPLHMFLAAQGMHHGRAEGVGQGHHLIVGAGTAAATQQGDFAAVFEDVGEALQVLFRRQRARCQQGRPRFEFIFYFQQ